MTPAPPAPPPLVRRLLARVLPPGTAGLSIQGDLLEEFRDRSASVGPRAARRWYRRQALALAWRYAFDPHRSSLGDRVGRLLRDAMRSLARAPRTTAGAVLSLGLAIGAATAIFTVVNTVLLTPLPYADAGRLVAIWDVDIDRQRDRQLLSPPTVLDYRRLDRVFDDVAAWWRPDATLRDAGLPPQRARVVETTGNLFALLGVIPAAGPGFPTPGPLHSPERIAVVSDRLWRERYGADPAIVGRLLRLNDDAYTVVGVMAAAFAFPGDVDVWTRLAWDPAPLGRGIHIFEGIGRLAPGATPASATRELTALTERLGVEHPDTNKSWRATARPLLDEVVGYYRVALLAMAAAVALLLGSACLNVASLLLARATARAGELSLRAALGASRGQLVSLLLVESLAISTLSTITGAAAALTLLQASLPLLPVEVPRLSAVTIDVRVLAFAAAVTSLTAVLFGLAPALLATRRATPLSALAGGRTAATGQQRRVSRVIVAGEVALACAVLVGAGLLVRSVDRMTRVASGVEAADVLTVELQPDGPSYEAWEATMRFHAAVVDALAARPGLDAVGATSVLPLRSAYRMRFARPDRPGQTGIAGVTAQHISVDAGYFDVVRARLVEGRGFAVTDVLSSDPVVVLNETMARLAFGDESPVGRAIVPQAVAIGPFGHNLAGRVPHRVVGVVADIQQAGIGRAPDPVMYFTQRQFPAKTMFVTVRGDAAARATVLEAVRSVDPSVPIGPVAWLRDAMLAESGPARLLMAVLVAFATMMAATAAAGLYALLAWNVSRERRELAIRQALGASDSRLAGRVLLEGLGLAAVGAVAGLALATAGARGLEAFLFRTSAADPVVAGAAVLIVIATALAASIGPARRVRRLDPIAGLRADG